MKKCSMPQHSHSHRNEHNFNICHINQLLFSLRLLSVFSLILSDTLIHCQLRIFLIKSKSNEYTLQKEQKQLASALSYHLFIDDHVYATHAHEKQLTQT